MAREKLPEVTRTMQVLTSGLVAINPSGKLTVPVLEMASPTGNIPVWYLNKAYTAQQR